MCDLLLLLFMVGGLFALFAQFIPSFDPGTVLVTGSLMGGAMGWSVAGDPVLGLMGGLPYFVKFLFALGGAIGGVVANTMLSGVGVWTEGAMWGGAIGAIASAAVPCPWTGDAFATWLLLIPWHLTLTVLGGLLGKGVEAVA